MTVTRIRVAKKRRTVGRVAQIVTDADVRHVAQTVRDAIARLQASAGGQRLVSRLFDGADPLQVLDDLDWDGWRKVLDGANGLLIDRTLEHEQGALLAIEGHAGALFGGSMEAARAAAVLRVGERIVGITDTTRAAVEKLVTEALRRGDSVPRLAAVLRDVVGLNETQGRALDRFRAGLEANGTFSDSYIAHATGQYRDQLARARSTMISRTELSDAANRGRLDAWGLAQASGALGPDALKQWLIGPNPCPECEALDGEEVPLAESFSNGDDAPPDHPGCVCAAIVSDVGREYDDVSIEA